MKRNLKHSVQKFSSRPQTARPASKGFVTDVMKALTYSYFYACGPEVMLKAIDTEAKTSGQLSFEERMGCGFGACMGCSCRTKYGNKRICKEGPVLGKRGNHMVDRDKESRRHCGSGYFHRALRNPP